MYNTIKFVYKPSYPITEISPDPSIEDIEDNSTNPDLVLFKFEDGSVVSSTNRAIRSYFGRNTRPSRETREDFVSLPPKVDFSNQNCFHIIGREFYPINSYLGQNYYDYVILKYNDPARIRNNEQYTCFSRQELKNTTQNNNAIFFKCTESRTVRATDPNDSSVQRESTLYYLDQSEDYKIKRPDFIKLSEKDLTLLIDYKQFVKETNKVAFEFVITPIFF